LGSVAGKAVKIRRGPAAVTEDEFHIISPLFVFKWEGAEIRLIRKPEYLILTLLTKPSRPEVSLAKSNAIPLISLERGYSGGIATIQFTFIRNSNSSGSLAPNANFPSA
jgi:hypothetical protein